MIPRNDLHWTTDALKDRNHIFLMETIRLHLYEDHQNWSHVRPTYVEWKDDLRNNEYNNFICRSRKTKLNLTSTKVYFFFLPDSMLISYSILHDFPIYLLWAGEILISYTQNQVECWEVPYWSYFKWPSCPKTPTNAWNTNSSLFIVSTSMELRHNLSGE